jgi:hypothetical protein
MKPAGTFAPAWMLSVEKTENSTQTGLPNKGESFAHVMGSPDVGKTSGSVDPGLFIGCEGPDFSDSSLFYPQHFTSHRIAANSN